MILAYSVMDFLALVVIGALKQPNHSFHPIPVADSFLHVLTPKIHLLPALALAKNWKQPRLYDF